MNYSNQVAIGPEFFKKAFNDYADWGWALVREFFQNSADAGSHDIHFNISSVDGNTVLEVRNDGKPMTRDILVDKLLALGGSGKNFEGSVGGFGKAKELLYFCHVNYSIHTGNLLVKGSGAGYEISEVDHMNSGTTSVITLDGNHTQKIIDSLVTFASFCQWDGVLYMNGHHITTNLRKGSPRRDVESGVVYTNKCHPGKLIVRMHGIPMFWSRIGLDNRGVILELNGKSSECLTSNRDGLVGVYQRELNDFITSLSVDKRSALRSKGTRYKRFAGDRFRYGGAPVSVNVGALVAALPTDNHDISDAMVSVQKMLSGNAPSRSCIGEEFIVKNETDLSIPNYYLPDSTSFSPYSKKLVRMWGRCLLELHRLFEKDGDFAIGFIFDTQCEAEYEKGQYGTVYYLNPATIVESATFSKSFKKRFKLTEKNRLLMIALHEFVHGCGYLWHDENYATHFTNMAWKVMEERKRFNWCFA